MRAYSPAASRPPSSPPPPLGSLHPRPLSTPLSDWLRGPRLAQVPALVDASKAHRDDADVCEQVALTLTLTLTLTRTLTRTLTLTLPLTLALALPYP